MSDTVHAITRAGKAAKAIGAVQTALIGLIAAMGGYLTHVINRQDDKIDKAINLVQRHIDAPAHRETLVWREHIDAQLVELRKGREDAVAILREIQQELRRRSDGR
jgi:hypothetical protein